MGDCSGCRFDHVRSQRGSDADYGGVRLPDERGSWLEPNPDRRRGCSGWIRFDVRIATGRVGVAEVRRENTDGDIGDHTRRSHSLSSMDYKPYQLLLAVWCWKIDVSGASANRRIDSRCTVVRTNAWQIVFDPRRYTFARYGTVPVICTVVHERQRRRLAHGMVLDGNLGVDNRPAIDVDCLCE